MPMNRMVLCNTLALCVLGSGIYADTPPARAGESSARSGATNSSSGTAATPPRGDATRGEELYNASCVVCHGTRAIGGIGPRLAGNPVLSNDQAFWKIVHEGRHMMPPQKGVVSDQQLADIRAWLRTLR
jgi:mono/diheme cytochrome c family protein